MAEPGHALDDLQTFLNEKPRWLFGHLGYDLKNETEGLPSGHPDKVGFPVVFFFEPTIVIRLSENKMAIEVEDEAEAEKIFSEIMDAGSEMRNEGSDIQIQQRVSKQEYIDTIERLKKHILRGDCYEINYCMEFFAENAVVDPLSVYQKLSSTSPNPFSALYKLDDKWLICASPERFLKKRRK